MSNLIPDPVIRRLSGALAERRMTQRNVAEILGLTQQAVSRRFTGDVPFRVDELQKLAARLEIPASRFLEPDEYATEAAR